MITKGFRVRIYPNSKQKLLINKHFGCYRFIWNYYLTKNNDYYKETGKFLCNIDFCRDLTTLRQNENYSWLKEVSCVSLQQTLRNLDKTLLKFSRRSCKYPKFKRKKDFEIFSYSANSQNFYFRSDKICVIEKIGRVKFKTDFKFNLGRDYCETFKNVWVLRERNKYFITFDLELENQKEELNDYTIGIDLGLRNLVTIFYQDNFKFYKNFNKSKEMKVLERRIKLLQRDISRKYRQNNPKECFEKGR